MSSSSYRSETTKIDLILALEEYIETRDGDSCLCFEDPLMEDKHECAYCQAKKLLQQLRGQAVEADLL